MLKSLGFLALWLVGTATAVAVAWAGVAVVDSELVNPAPANTLALRQASDEPSIPTSTTPDVSSPRTGEALNLDQSLPRVGEIGVVASGRSSADVASASSPEVDSSGVASDAAPTSATPTTDVPATAEPATTTPTTAAPTTTSPSASTTTTTTTTTTTAASSQTLTFHLIGGSTSISFSPAGATVLWASPNPGFDVDIDDGAESRVEFESDDHKTRIDVWWSGKPQHEIREDAD